MELKIEYKNLEHLGLDGGGNEMLSYEGQPFTGFIVEYYVNENLLAEDEYKNGCLEGWHREYYEDGQLKEEYKLQNNIVVNDTFKEYDNEGNLIGSF